MTHFFFHFSSIPTYGNNDAGCGCGGGGGDPLGRVLVLRLFVFRYWGAVASLLLMWRQVSESLSVSKILF